MLSDATYAEQKPFLSHHEDTGGGEILETRKGHSIFWKLGLHAVLFVVQIGLMALNVALLWRNNAAALDYQRNHENFDQTYSPAQSVVQYIVQDSMLHSSPFTGEPRPEVDQAWSQLLRSSMIRISEEELKRMNKTSIRLRDGSGYVGYLEAIHMLHCVKRMYQSRHPEHYVELQGTEAFSSEHWDHCLEVLRKGIMCNADVTINTYQWKTPIEIKGQSSGPRKCTDWDRIQAWADERMLKFDGVDNYIEKLVPKAVDMMTVSALVEQ